MSYLPKPRLDDLRATEKAILDASKIQEKKLEKSGLLQKFKVNTNAFMRSLRDSTNQNRQAHTIHDLANDVHQIHRLEKHFKELRQEQLRRSQFFDKEERQKWLPNLSMLMATDDEIDQWPDYMQERTYMGQLLVLMFENYNQRTQNMEMRDRICAQLAETPYSIDALKLTRDTVAKQTGGVLRLLNPAMRANHFGKTLEDAYAGDGTARQKIYKATLAVRNKKFESEIMLNTGFMQQAGLNLIEEMRNDPELRQTILAGKPRPPKPKYQNNYGETGW